MSACRVRLVPAASTASEDLSGIMEGLGGAQAAFRLRIDVTS
jgi:hypothetical protein